MVLIPLQLVLEGLGLSSSLFKPFRVQVGGIVGDNAVTDELAILNGGRGNVLLGATAAPAKPGFQHILSVVSPTTSSSELNATDSGDYSLASFGTATEPPESTSPYITMDADSSGDNANCSIQSYSPGPIPLDNFAPFDPSQAMIYRYRQQQTVNLGSWFVQEQWMNPTLFTCAAGAQQAELDVAQGWGGVDNAQQVLERHWDEWIQESDFEYLAGIGINTVRLPIGYWSLGPIYCKGTVFEPVSQVYSNAWARVVRAINWASKYDLGVLVDLHGAPGSQNGQAHSGTSDGQQNLFSSPDNIQLTVNVLTYLTQQLVKVNNVVGIQLLNEPSNVDGLPSFYTNTLATLREVSPEAATFPFYINDAYDMPRFADYISTRQDFLVLDHHSYFVFDQTSEDTSAPDLTSSLVPGSGSLSGQILEASQEVQRNVVIDEWSCALSSQSLGDTSNPGRARRNFCTGQMESYTNATAGWGFWSYKTENCDDDDNWCFLSAVGKSLPQTFFSYPNVSAPSIDMSVMDPPDLSPEQAILSFGATMPFGSHDDDHNQGDELLASMDFDHSLAQINEALAAAPQESIEANGTATSPSSRSQQQDRRGLSIERGFLRSSFASAHRFIARHRRRTALSRKMSTERKNPRRDDAVDVVTPEQVAISRGYTDGWDAAKAFAAHARSRLGFTGQFMNDALSAMKGQIVAGNEQYYKSWFVKGLADGELHALKAAS